MMTPYKIDLEQCCHGDDVLPSAAVSSASSPHLGSMENGGSNSKPLSHTVKKIHKHKLWFLFYLHNAHCNIANHMTITASHD